MLGLVAAVVALSILFLGRLVRGTDATPRVAVRLMAFQLTTFAAMEVLERLGSGAGVRQLLPALLVGIPTQVVVAGIVAVLVRCTLRAASIVADRTPRASAAWSVDALVRIVPPLAVAPARPGRRLGARSRASARFLTRRRRRRAPARTSRGVHIDATNLDRASRRPPR